MDGLSWKMPFRSGLNGENCRRIWQIRWNFRYSGENWWTRMSARWFFDGKKTHSTKDDLNGKKMIFMASQLITVNGFLNEHLQETWGIYMDFTTKQFWDAGQMTRSGTGSIIYFQYIIPFTTVYHFYQYVQVTSFHFNMIWLNDWPGN